MSAVVTRDRGYQALRQRVLSISNREIGTDDQGFIIRTEQFRISEGKVSVDDIKVKSVILSTRDGLLSLHH